MKSKNKILINLIIFSALTCSLAEASTKKNLTQAKIIAGPAKTPVNVNEEKKDADSVEWTDVDKIKEKYWARGDESELGVVQNRVYSKEHKLEVGTFVGLLSSDPFLDVTNVGASIGYHLSETFSGHLLGWKSLVSPSSALKLLQEPVGTGGLGTTANTNKPKFFLGAEGQASVLYGKLSVLGKAIIYYDFHFNGGLGMTGTESGSYLTPFIGLGQKVYLSKNIALSVDYRIMRYNENIVEKILPTKIGQVVGQRDNWSHSVNLGVSFLIGG